VGEFLKWYDTELHPNKGIAMFAVYDKTGVAATGDPEGVLAGIMGYTNTSAPNLSTEIAWVLTSPRFQRTHVTSHAIGLLLHYALDLPSDGGLGLRRVEWRTSTLNEGSLRAAERMGFKRDGHFRWAMVLPQSAGKTGNGRPRRAGDPREDNAGRDTVSLAVCWDEWEDSVKDQVNAVMERTN
jgi:RimJ/RimL family protein N-acetyltransferase